MRDMLNEKQWRHYLALEAQERGSVMQVAQEAKVSHNTILRACENWKRETASVQEIDSERKEEEGNKQWTLMQAYSTI